MRPIRFRSSRIENDLASWPAEQDAQAIQNVSAQNPVAAKEVGLQATRIILAIVGQLHAALAAAMRLPRAGAERGVRLDAVVVGRRIVSTRYTALPLGR